MDRAPYLPLGDADLDRVHDATLQILEENGVQFTLGEAQAVFRDAGLKVSADGVVRFPAQSVEAALRTVPARFSRQPLHASYPAVRYGDGELSFTSSSTPLWVLDAGARRLRAATMRDTEDFARLVDALPNLSCANGGVWAREIPPRVFHAVYFHLMVQNTAKPIPAGDILNRTVAEDLIRLAEIVSGGRGELERKKSFSLTACPASKCRWGDNVLAFIEGARAGMVLKIMPMGSSTWAPPRTASAPPRPPSRQPASSSWHDGTASRPRSRWAPRTPSCRMRRPRGRR
jgi:trimethylamine--corrinoid protein Co-methyltransferase